MKEINKEKENNGPLVDTIDFITVNHNGENKNDTLWLKTSPKEVVNYYESMGDWKSSLPKTDYTYSPISEFYNKEIAPGIPTIPNMCRSRISRSTSSSSSSGSSTVYYTTGYGLDSDIERKVRSKMVNVLHHNDHYSSKSNFNYKQYNSDNNNSSSSSILSKIAITLFSGTVASVKSVSDGIFRFSNNFASSLVNISYKSLRSVAVAYSKNKKIFYFMLLMVLAFFGFHLIRDMKPLENRYLLNDIHLYADNVAANTVARVNKLADSAVVVRTIFSKISLTVQDILHTGINVPWTLIKVLFYSLFDIVTSSGTLLLSWLVYILKFADTTFLTRQSPSAEILVSNTLNYTKLAETLLTVKEFKELIVESESVVELRKAKANSKSSDSSISLEEISSVLKTINSTVIENVVGEYVETVIKRLLRDHFVPASNGYVTEQYFNDMVNSLRENLTGSMKEDLQNAFNEYSDKSETSLYSLMEKHLSEQQPVPEGQRQRENSGLIANFTDFEAYINRTIQRALKVYDADKTGMVDYALETSGGVILNTRCTETMKSPVSFSVFNIPLWQMETNPRIVIQPGVHPGQCWAFSGSLGYLVIQLSQPIFVTGFTLEHIPRSLAPNGIIDSAPKEFSVWGLFHETKLDSQVLLGRFDYNVDGDSIQYFEAIKAVTPFQIVELRIESNHGKIEYTCIYRFRVHGIPVTR